MQQGHNVDKAFAQGILFKTQITNKFRSRHSKTTMETAQKPSCGLDDWKILAVFTNPLSAIQLLQMCLASTTAIVKN